MSVRSRIDTIKHLQNKYFICVLENPHDDKNLGTTIRNISAFGVEKLYVVGGTNMPKSFQSSRTNSRIRKLSVGANKWVFVKHFKTTKDCIDHLQIDRYTIAVTSPHIKGAHNVNLYEGDFTQKRIAVWFGNESKGISKEAVESADMCIQIPMAKNSDVYEFITMIESELKEI